MNKEPSSLRAMSTNGVSDASAGFDLAYGDDGTVTFRRVLEAVDVVRLHPLLSVFLALPLAFVGYGLILFFLPDLLPDELVTFLAISWPGWALGLLAFGVGAIRFLRRPRAIVFDPKAREFRIVPGLKISFEDVVRARVVSYSNTETGPDKQIHEVYVRVHGRSVILATPGTRHEADKLANALTALMR